MEIAGFVLKSPRRIVHRPKFDILERRILPTVQVIPLADGVSYPLSLRPDSEGGLWLNLMSGDEVDHVAPDGTVARIPLGPSPGLYGGLYFKDIHNGLTIGPDGNLWVSGLLNVDRVTPGGVVTTFANGGPNGWPAGNYPSSIVTGPDGALWFDGFNGSIGRVTTGGSVTLYPLPDPEFHASSITAGPDGALWFTTNDQIGRVTTDGIFEEFTSTAKVPDNPLINGLSVDDITLGPDGNLWFVVYGGNQIGRITPDGQQEYFTIPTTTASPTSLQVGPDGAIWFAEQGAGQIGRITTDGQISEYSLPNPPRPGSNSFSTPIEIAFGPDGSLWYTTSFDDPQAGPGKGGTAGATPHEIVHLDPSVFTSIDAQPSWTTLETGPVFSGTVAEFQPITPGDPAGDYSATIDWGDGSTSVGTLVSTGPGSFEVDGSHAFNGTGPFTVSVSVTTQQASLASFAPPTDVQETLTIDASGGTTTVAQGPPPVSGPIPGPGPVSDASSPPLLPPAEYLVAPSLLAVAPPPVALSSTLPTATIPVVEGEPAEHPASTTVLISTPSPSQVIPLVTVESTSQPSAGVSGLDSAASPAPSATGPATTLGASSRAVKPVPTLGIASQKLPGARRSARPAPKPLRVARANLLDFEIIAPAAPENGLVVSAP